MKHSLFTSFCLLMLSILVGISQLSAQQNLWQKRSVVSPEIGADGSVTIRLYAPAAQSVVLNGDFAEGSKSGQMTMIRNDEGVWEYRSEPLASELYCYWFSVDGIDHVVDPSNSYVMRDVGSQMNYFIIPGGRGDLYAAQRVPHGTLSRVWCPVNDGRERRMTIYTPADYEESTSRYPVLYLLHGMGGDEEAWVATGRVAEIMDNLIAQGKAEPMIIVMTNGCTKHVAAPGYSHEGMWAPYMSGSMDGSFEAMFPSIVEWIDSNYRTIAERESRAIAGLSMGGFHSMQISKEYPDMFSYVGLFSAAIFRGKEGVATYDDLEAKLERQFNMGLSLYWIAIGSEDFLYDENVKYRNLLDAKGYKYEYCESGDGHVWRNWRIYLADFSQMLFR
ncbi:MAG: esterase [Alistipes sp.]|nr:esterase [Alistipes sp.]